MKILPSSCEHKELHYQFKIMNVYYYKCKDCDTSLRDHEIERLRKSKKEFPLN